ncbi:MAG: glycosyltransferase [Deltaproteobacteria bacterium]|nr:glycosyltransferase [Deltaproteobacteria bacterium]
MSIATIVIPCFNEAKRLDLAAFEQFAAENPESSFLFVDDGSTDDTRKILDGLATRISDRASVLVLEQNSGKAEAVRRGVNRALEAEPTYVGYWDADLATPLPVIREFSELLEGNPQLQMIMGARVQLLGRHIERSALRHYAGRIAATAISTVLRLRVYDTQCGAKLFRANAARELFSEPFRTRWIFDAEIIARLIARLGANSDPSARDVIYEVPLHAWMDVRGSKIGPSDYLRAAVDLLRIYGHYVRRSR